MLGLYNKEMTTRIHRVQRELYNKVPLPLVKMEVYPQQDLRISQPILGSYIRGFVDPAISAYPEAWSTTERKPFRYEATQQRDEPEIPGVPGSGRRGKEVRDKMQQEKNEQFHRMGDANADPSQVKKLQQMVSGGGAQSVQQSAQQSVQAFPDQMDWR